jgi:hypothetical protein
VSLFTTVKVPMFYAIAAVLTAHVAWMVIRPEKNQQAP